MPPIPATNPTVIPAEPERVYPSWLILQFTIERSEAPGNPYQLRALFRKFRTDEAGVEELGPPDAIAFLLEPDIYGVAATDAEVAQALGQAIAVIARLAAERGLL